MSLEELTRPIIGLESRTPQEVFDIMKDRIIQQAESVEPVAWAYDHPCGETYFEKSEAHARYAARMLDDPNIRPLFAHPPLHRDASELVEALKEAMGWNWLDESDTVPQEVKDQCESALANWESRDETD